MRQARAWSRRRQYFSSTGSINLGGFRWIRRVKILQMWDQPGFRDIMWNFGSRNRNLFKTKAASRSFQTATALSGFLKSASHLQTKIANVSMQLAAIATYSVDPVMMIFIRKKVFARQAADLTARMNVGKQHCRALFDNVLSALRRCVICYC